MFFLEQIVALINSGEFAVCNRFLNCHIKLTFCTDITRSNHSLKATAVSFSELSRQMFTSSQQKNSQRNPIGILMVRNWGTIRRLLANSQQ